MTGLEAARRSAAPGLSLRHIATSRLSEQSGGRSKGRLVTRSRRSATIERRGVAELADARDLKFRIRKDVWGSIPTPGTKISSSSRVLRSKHAFTVASASEEKWRSIYNGRISRNAQSRRAFGQAETVGDLSPPSGSWWKTYWIGPTENGPPWYGSVPTSCTPFPSAGTRISLLRERNSSDFPSMDHRGPYRMQPPASVPSHRR